MKLKHWLYAGLWVFSGGRIGYVLFYNFLLFAENPLYLFKVWDGGMSFHGGLMGVIIACGGLPAARSVIFLQVG